MMKGGVKQMAQKCKANSDNLRGHKVRIYPTEEQKDKILSFIDSYRAIYNIAIGSQIDYYRSGGIFITFNQMCKKFADMRNNNENFKWLNNMSIGIIREALIDADVAFTKFFAKINRFPKFKSKKRSKKSFGTRSDRCHIDGRNIYISGVGLVDAKDHHIPEGVRMYKTRITYDGYDKFWFSCTTEKDMEFLPIEGLGKPIGVDVGIRHMITTSDGEVYELSNFSKLNKRLKQKTRRAMRSMRKYINQSKRTKIKYEDIPKSKNHYKRMKEWVKISNRIENKKSYDTNVATRRIIDKHPSAIVIEDLCLSKMRKRNWMKKFVPQIVFRDIHRQLEYKAAELGIPVIKADRLYPSSQLCSNCGSIRKLNSSVYKCKVCGLRIDRDLNAAINLRNLAYKNAYV